MVGNAAYRLVAVGLRWSRRGAALLKRTHLRPRSEPTENTVGVTFRVRRVSDLTPLARARIWLWLRWAHQLDTKWAAFDWYVSAETGGSQVCIAGIVDREGAIGGVPTRLGLLGGVLTVSEHRHHGLASEVIKLSTKLMADELHCDFGVLLCGDKLVPFYERLGWKLVSNVLTFVRFGETGVVNDNVMVYECAGRPLPAGPIDVKGLPA